MILINRKSRSKNLTGNDKYKKANGSITDKACMWIKKQKQQNQLKLE